MKTTDTTTVELLISVGKVGSELNYNKLSYKIPIKDEFAGDINFPEYNVVWDYVDNLKASSFVAQLTDDEFQKYKFKPKLLCKDLYGNQEVYFIILIINDMIDETEFNSKIIKLLSRDDMQKFMTSIYNSNYQFLKKYDTLPAV